MRISEAAGPMPGIAGRLRRRQTGFSVPDETEAGEGAAAGAADVESASSASALAGIGAEVFREAVPPGARDHAAAVHGRALLDALKGLQLACLGQGEAAALEHLAGLAQGLPQAQSPALSSIIDAIAARAAVVMARMGR